MDDFKTKDSGKREDFATGSKRDTREGKGRFDLIPTMPLRRLAGLYERGAEKYGDNNWQKGQPLQRTIDSAFRHLNELRAGEPTEDHAMAIVWNIFTYVWTLDAIRAGRLPADLDDRPPPEPQYAVMPEAPSPPESVADAMGRLNPTWGGPKHLQPKPATIERCDQPDCTVCGGPQPVDDLEEEPRPPAPERGPIP